MKKVTEIEAPVSRSEEVQYQMLIRLDALVHMMSSLIDHIAKKEGIATETNTVSEKKTTAKRKTTSTKKKATPKKPTKKEE